MYSWGRSTKNWKDPGAYKYDSARAPYLDKLAAASKGPRTYTARTDGPDLGLTDARGKVLTTESKNPVVIAVDVTGSMASWPGEIFDRLPLLYQTLSQYREDLEICFAAIGDANCDNYPLQVTDFAKGVDLEAKLKALFPEGGGGGQVSESYELFGYYMLNHCNTPKATSPFLLIYGDEKFYSEIEPGQVKSLIGDRLENTIESAKVWKGLMQRFNLFYMHKPYGHGNEPDTDKEVKAYWENAIGAQRIIELPSADRAVDMALGLIAKTWGEYDDFTTSLAARHPESEVQDSVHDSLRFIDSNPSSNSIVTAKLSTKRTKSLLD